MDNESVPTVGATIEQIRELAQTIADQAQAIADNTVTGSVHAQVARLVNNVDTLKAWTPDDRTA